MRILLVVLMGVLAVSCSRFRRDSGNADSTTTIVKLSAMYEQTTGQTTIKGELTTLSGAPIPLDDQSDFQHNLVGSMRSQNGRHTFVETLNGFIESHEFMYSSPRFGVRGAGDIEEIGFQNPPTRIERGEEVVVAWSGAEIKSRGGLYQDQEKVSLVVRPADAQTSARSPESEIVLESFTPGQKSFRIKLGKGQFRHLPSGRYQMQLRRKIKMLLEPNYQFRSHLALEYVTGFHEVILE